MKSLLPIFIISILLAEAGIYSQIENTEQKKISIKKVSLQQEKRNLPKPSQPLPLPGNSFTEKLQTFYSSLPKLSEYRMGHSAEDAHQTPQVVLESASIFTELDTTYYQPENFENIAKFYDLCVYNEDLFSSVRAVCFFKLSQLNSHLTHPYDLSKFPPTIRELGAIKGFPQAEF